MKLKAIRFWRASIAYFCVALAFSGSAQETNDGKLRSQSLGRVNLSLEITNRPNPTLILINRGDGTFTIPGFVAETLTRALSQNRNVEFPVCIVDGSGDEITVSVENEEKMFTGEKGEKIPFEVSLKGNKALAKEHTKRVQYIKPENEACNEDSSMKLKITLPEDAPPASTSLLRGRFKLTITAE
jgi:hypothetical protein